VHSGCWIEGRQHQFATGSGRSLGEVRVRRRAVQTPASDRLLRVVREEPGRFPDFEVGGYRPGA